MTGIWNKDDVNCGNTNEMKILTIAVMIAIANLSPKKKFKPVTEIWNKDDVNCGNTNEMKI